MAQRATLLTCNPQVKVADLEVHAGEILWRSVLTWTDTDPNAPGIEIWGGPSGFETWIVTHHPSMGYFDSGHVFGSPAWDWFVRYSYHSDNSKGPFSDTVTEG